MARFATLAALVSALTAIAIATPIAGEETQVLEKRVTHTGKVSFHDNDCIINAHRRKQATYYYPGLGACGKTDSNSDPVVAISHLIYGSGGNCFQVLTPTPLVQFSARSDRRIQWI